MAHKILSSMPTYNEGAEGEVLYGHRYVALVDGEADVNTLPADASAGSLAFTADNRFCAMLDLHGEWVRRRSE